MVLALVPPELVSLTSTTPVLVDAGETAVIEVGEVTVNSFAAGPTRECDAGSALPAPVAPAAAERVSRAGRFRLSEVSR